MSYYHGTTREWLEQIVGNTGAKRSYTNPNRGAVYAFSGSKARENAEFWALNHARNHGGEPIIIEITKEPNPKDQRALGNNVVVYDSLREEDYKIIPLDNQSPLNDS